MRGVYTIETYIQDVNLDTYLGAYIEGALYCGGPKKKVKIGRYVGFFLIFIFFYLYFFIQRAYGTLERFSQRK